MKCVLCGSGLPYLYLEKKLDPNDGPSLYWKCETCGLVFADPKSHLSLEAQKKRYDCHHNSPEDEGYVQFLRKLADPMLAKGALGRLLGLDFGRGPGPALSVIFQKAGHTVENYDPIYFPDPSLLERTFDFITCTETIEHFTDPRKEFDLLNQMLKPEAYLGLMTEILEPDTDFATWWYHKDPTHVAFYSQETFKWLANFMGWEMEYPRKNVVIFKKGNGARDKGKA